MEQIPTPSFCANGPHERILDSQGKCCECMRVHKKKWALANPDKVKAAKKAWNEANREKIREQAKHRPSRAKANDYARASRQRYPEKYKERAEAYRAKRIGAPGVCTAAEWRAILKKWKNKCALCGLGRTKKSGYLTKDHIIPLSQGGTNFAHNIQPAHGSCNSRKSASLVPGMQHSLFEGTAKENPTCKAGRHPKDGPGKCRLCELSRKRKYNKKRPTTVAGREASKVKGNHHQKL